MITDDNKLLPRHEQRLMLTPIQDLRARFSGPKWPWKRIVKAYPRFAALSGLRRRLGK